MQDIVTKADRVKEIIADASGRGGGQGPNELEMSELASIGIDVVAEIVANSRRSASALESIADSLKNLAAQHGAA